MNASDVIAYAYNAAYHCEDCAIKAHGKRNLGNLEYCEGHEIGAVFCGQEVDGYYPETCDDCHAELNGFVYLDAIRAL